MHTPLILNSPFGITFPFWCLQIIHSQNWLEKISFHKTEVFANLAKQNLSKMKTVTYATINEIRWRI